MTRLQVFLSNTAATHGGALPLDCAPTCTITNRTFHANEVTAGFGGAIFGDKLRVNDATFAPARCDLAAVEAGLR